MPQEPFYIYFERSGGFAGLTQTLEINSDTLSVEDQDHLRQLIDSSSFFSIKKPVVDNLPDQFNYSVTIKYKGEEKTIGMGDESIPDTLRPLVNYLTKMTRTQH